MNSPQNRISLKRYDLINLSNIVDIVSISPARTWYLVSNNMISRLSLGALPAEVSHRPRCSPAVYRRLFSAEYV